MAKTSYILIYNFIIFVFSFKYIYIFYEYEYKYTSSVKYTPETHKKISFMLINKIFKENDNG